MKPRVMIWLVLALMSSVSLFAYLWLGLTGVMEIRPEAFKFFLYLGILSVCILEAKRE